jgi:hypothetical protein
MAGVAGVGMTRRGRRCVGPVRRVEGIDDFGMIEKGWYWYWMKLKWWWNLHPADRYLMKQRIDVNKRKIPRDDGCL